jgi:CspA family cold shock protein
MATGKLNMWNAERGYGFIANDDGGPDMFLHVSALSPMAAARKNES